MTDPIYVGLTGRFEITPGERTPLTPHSEVPLEQKIMSNKSERQEVKGEMVYPFPAEKCFDMMKDYRQFLLTHLKDNERQFVEKTGKPFCAKPMWVTDDEKEQGKVGSIVKYAYYMNDVVYWLAQKITTLEDSGEERDCNGNKFYRFAVETMSVRSSPDFPLEGNQMQMIFTTFNNDPNQCHVQWIRIWYKPYILLGSVCVNDGFVAMFQEQIQRDMNNFWILLHATYSKDLPKKHSKVVVVGAGPSGLHMTYELIQRGLPKENITILEKDDRYGGKTVSVVSGSNVQVSDAKYAPPPPYSAMLPKVQSILHKYYTCKTIREALVMWFQGDFSPVRLEQIQRENTPNALLYQEDSDYFRGGEPVYHELGTCYMSPGYYAIRTLLKRIQGQVVEKAKTEKNDQGQWNVLADQDLTKEVGPDTYAIESKEWDGALTLPQWIEKAAEKTLRWNCCDDSSTGTALVANASVLAAKLKYCKLHNEYLGAYQYTMPPRPDKEQFHDLIIPFSEFMMDKGLMAMEPLFTYALTAQGYGVVSSTPTFLAMQWLTPDLLDGYFEWYYYFLTYKNSAGEIVKQIPPKLKKFDNYRKSMIVASWGGLWDRIVLLYDLEKDKNLLLNTEVTKIARDGGKVQVEYKLEGKESFQETFDYLVVAAPMSDPVIDPTKPLFEMDLSPTEKSLFLSPGITASTFRTTLFEPEANGKYESDHLRIFIDAILGDSGEESNVGRGEVFGVRDSYKALQPRLSKKNGDLYDPSKVSPREKMCYQYISPKEKRMGATTTQEFEEKMMALFYKFMEEHPDYFIDLPDQSTSKYKKKRIDNMYIRSKAWTYYTHFEGDDLSSGKLWQILDIQGKSNTFFVHASTNFESVLDIVNYNYMILDGLAGRLDNFLPPDTDTRPTPEERPQVVLFNQLILHNVFRSMLNFFLLILWTAWYIVSYPFAEGIYLRFQRYELQKAYATPDLGSPWSYNLTYFNNVSPLVRGYMDYLAGKPNGIPKDIPPDYDPYVWDPNLGPGDTVFKILQAPKNKFLTEHPEIPNHLQIPTSIFWNLTDTRTAVRFWLTTFDDTFQPLLTPFLQKVIQSFSYFAPNYYSFFMSWIFAGQFRLLIGYSYRFEDEFGGGLRIPDCHMLRVAIQDHGVEGGQRICLTVCKIFVEETMRAKCLKLDFQPDYLRGSGHGCTVRMENPVNQAYSNHSLYKMRTKKEKEEFKDIDMSW